MAALRSLLAALVVLGALGVYQSAVLVGQHEVAVKLHMGQVVESDLQPGLHFKLPLLQTVHKFDQRTHTLLLDRGRVPAGDGRELMVDGLVYWRVGDAGAFYAKTQGEGAEVVRVLTTAWREALQASLAELDVTQVLAADRAQVLAPVVQQLGDSAEAMGVTLEDIRLRSVDLPEESVQKALQRMQARQERLARERRAAAEDEAAHLAAEAERRRAGLIAAGRLDAERIRGEADAQAAEIYAQAAGRDPEFFVFYRSLAAYRKAFDGDDLLLLPPDSDFFRYFQQSRPAPAR